MALSEFNIPKRKIAKILLLTGKIIKDEELSSNLKKKLKP